MTARPATLIAGRFGGPPTWRTGVDENCEHDDADDDADYDEDAGVVGGDGCGVGGVLV